MRTLFLAAALALPLAGCGKEKTTAPAPAPSDASIAQDLWAKMSSQQYTVPGTEWSMFPGKTGIYEPDPTLLGSDPHLGPVLFQTFVNGPARTALDANTFPLADGAIIAKQNYIVSGSDTTLAAVTVMFKRSGYHPVDKDWFWAKFKPDGQVEDAGKIQMCIGCHRGVTAHYAMDRDYVWTRTPTP